jgi:ribonucleoside-diphosphate reductase alpha chain
MNLLRWEEWKDTDAIQLSIWFLDAVLSEYIRKIEEQGIPGFEPALLSARKGRAIGLGVLGWHSLLQARSIPFDSFESMFLNSQIFRKLQSEAEIATRDLALAYGEPEWCKGHGRRNTHLIAVAPTVSNSIISGSVSPGIEPIAANVFSLKTSKGVFIRKNLLLEKLLADRGENTPEVWNQVIKDNGSVSSLKCMTDHEKEVFQTALEINQFAIIKQASQRQKWIDQAQSLNLFFGINSDPQYIQNCHIQAWKDGIKTLYYLRAESALKGDNVSRQADECRACEA